MSNIDYSGLAYQSVGTFFPLSEHEAVKPSVIPPAIPNVDTKTQDYLNHVQGFISDYTIDSLAHSFVVAQPYDFWIQNTDVPASSPFKLDTTDLTIFFPGLSTKYGTGLPMSIKININDMSGF